MYRGILPTRIKLLTYQSPRRRVRTAVLGAGLLARSIAPVRAGLGQRHRLPLEGKLDRGGPLVDGGPRRGEKVDVSPRLSKSLSKASQCKNAPLRIQDRLTYS